MSLRARARRGASIVDRLMLHRVIDGDCWLWDGFVEAGHCAKMGINGRTKAVHRVAYEELVGPIPDKMELDHVKARGCRFISCWNPAHLEPVTPAENKSRSATQWAVKARTGVCKHGHVQTASNTYVRPDNGNKKCRECMSNQGRARYARLRKGA